MLLKLKLLFISVASLWLTSCATDIDIHIKNSIPKSKLILESNPIQKNFYATTYKSISQSIYDNNIKILNLKDGENTFTINDDQKDYALYFILPNTSENNKAENWKYLVKTDSSKMFTISPDGKIIKD